MNHAPIAIALLFAAALTACQKKEQVEANTTVPAVVAASPAPPAVSPPAPAPVADPTPEEFERAKKQGQLDYATMEDSYINDTHGQWAQAVNASSTFGDDNGKTPSEHNRPALIAGAPDGKSWINNHQDMGFDWIEATFANPTSASAVRMVSNDSGVQSITKLELQDTAGNWSTVWSGLSDVKPDKRGPRNWFVKTFPKTAYQVKAVKITFANNVQSGYKEVDAIQLIRE